MTDLLDLLTIIEADNAPDGHAPEGYTADPRWTPDDLQDAYELRCRRAEFESERGTLGIAFWSHMWHCSNRQEPSGAHPIEVLFAYLACDTIHRGIECQCIGSHVYRAWCGQCCRWSQIHTDESAAVEDMHDHCWPGWRALPVGTAADRPEHWTQPGAPIVTRRAAIGRRAVPGRSPYGGYDLAAPDPI